MWSRVAKAAATLEDCDDYYSRLSSPRGRMLQGGRSGGLPHVLFVFYVFYALAGVLFSVIGGPCKSLSPSICCCSDDTVVAR